MDEVRAIVTGDGYLALPGRHGADDYELMERCTSSIAATSTADTLFKALAGHRPFRRFKDAVQYLGMADQWYAFRDSEYAQIAAGWCDINDVPCDR